MPGLTRRKLLWLPILLFILPLLSCKPQGYPDAPPGYDYRTLHVKWKFEGDKKGTRDLYLETSGYENGKLLFKRMADVRNLATEQQAKPGEFTADEGVYFNIEGTHYAVIKELETVGISKLEIGPVIRAQRLDFWLPIYRSLIRREDLTAEQRKQIQSRLFSITDEELIELGATIDEQDFMGHKVKRYVVPIADGTAEIWMYGDIPVKYKLESKWRGMDVKNTIEATEFEINKNLPEKVFTYPKSYKVIDRTKPIQEQ